MESSGQLDVLPSPLRKRNAATGALYERFPRVEATLKQLLLLPRKEVVLRCEIEEHENPDFVPSECIVSLLRGCRNEAESLDFKLLYETLMKRIIQRLPAAETKDGKHLLLKESRIQEGVVDTFQELLVLDCASYEERLDFWEVAFGLALKRLKTTVEKKVWRETNRSFTYENPNTGEAWDRVAEAEDAADPFDTEEL